MLRELCYGVVALVMLAYTADLYFNLNGEPGEPPRIRSNVPLVGHVLGLMCHGPTYYRRTRYG